MKIDVKDLFIRLGRKEHPKQIAKDMHVTPQAVYYHKRNPPQRITEVDYTKQKDCEHPAIKIFATCECGLTLSEHHDPKILIKILESKEVKNIIEQVI